MLLLGEIEINGVKEAGCVLAAQYQDLDRQFKVKTFDELLTNEKSVELLHTHGIEMKYVLIDFSGVKSIVLKPGSGQKVIDVRNLPNLYVKLTDEATKAKLQPYIAQQNQAMVTFNETLLIKLGKVLAQFSILVSEAKLPYNIRARFATPEVIEFATQFLPNKVETVEEAEDIENKDYFMEKPTDKLFLRLPTYMQLENLTSAVVYPNIAKALNPYRGRDYLKSYNWRQLKQPGDHDWEVLGDAKNNDLPIQENEKDYFEQLCMLMMDGIEAEYPDVDLQVAMKQGIYSNVVKEYCYKLLNICLIEFRQHVGNIPALKGSIVINDDIDDLEDSSSYSDEEDSEYGDASELEETYTGASFINVLPDEMKGQRPFNLMDALEAYIVGANNSFGWCEAVVKMLRWGERKPSKLKIDGTENYLDLETFKITSFGGRLGDLKTKVYEDGSTMVGLGFVSINNSVKDNSGYLIRNGYQDIRMSGLKTVLGVVAVKEFEGLDREQIVFIDLATLVYEYEVNGNKNFKVMGIDYENGQYRIAPSVGSNPDNNFTVNTLLNELEKDTQGTTHVELHPDIATMVAELNTIPYQDANLFNLWKLVITSYDVGQALEASDFDSKAELLEKVSEGSFINEGEGVMWKLVSDFVTIPFEVAKRLKGSFNLAEAIKIVSSLLGYSKVVKPVSEPIQEKRIEEKEDVKSEPTSVETTVTNVATSSAFAGNVSAPVVEEKTPVAETPVIEEKPVEEKVTSVEEQKPVVEEKPMVNIPRLSNMCAILGRQEKIVGWVAYINNKFYVYALDEVIVESRYAQDYTFKQIVVSAMARYSEAVEKNDFSEFETRYYFASKETPAKLWKEVMGD